MRHWRVVVRSDDGRHFVARSMEISASRAVLRGEQVVPAGTVCELQLIVPPLNETQPTTVASLRAEVGTVVFSGGDIRLEFRVKSLSREARALIEARRPGFVA